MIRLRDIHFSYDGREILQGLSLTVAPGDRIGLIGHTGAGKTTICRIIMGLVRPDSGDVEIFGKLRAVESDFVDIRGRIGYLFQDSEDQLFCPTVLDDVAFGPLNLGRSPDEAKEIVSRTLEALNLEGFEERLTHRLSGGEKRLVSLAGVLAMEPEILILDEPTTGLDAETQERIADVLVSSDLTYIVVSHDHEFIARTAVSTALLRDGILVPGAPIYKRG